jgi:predicted PurR-regulated permease PerM
VLSEEAVEMTAHERWPEKQDRYQAAAFAIGIGILLYLCWRIVAPFIPAIAWAFALAVIGDPIQSQLVRQLKSRGLASVLTLLLIIAVIIVPSFLLVRSLFQEAAELVRIANTNQSSMRENIERVAVLGPVLRWVDQQLDLPDLLRTVAASVSASLSSVVAGSIRLFAQVGVAVFVLFYFLRDSQTIIDTLNRILPLPDRLKEDLFSRIVHTLRLSLGGKIVTATIQGLLGGVGFLWVGLPAPVFWGFVMAMLSLVPAVGSPLIWLPAALLLFSEGDWGHGLFMVIWGLVIIHPVDNVLGPVLVGTTLRLHTLLMFFSIVGGLAAFGAAGVVIGPVVTALAVSLFDVFTSVPTQTLTDQRDG